MADSLRGLRAWLMSGAGRSGCGSLRGRRCSGAPGGWDRTHLPAQRPPGPPRRPRRLPAWATLQLRCRFVPGSLRSASSSNLGAPAAGRSPRYRAHSCSRPRPPHSPRSLAAQVRLRPGCARPLSPRALRTRAPRSRPRTCPRPPTPLHTHPIAAPTSVHLFTPDVYLAPTKRPRFIWEKQERGQHRHP